MAFAFKRKNHAIIEHMCGIVQIIMQRVYNEKLIRELEGLLRGLKSLVPCGMLEVKKIDKQIIINLNQIKAMIETGAPEEKIFALTADAGLQLLEREQKCKKTKKQKLYSR